MDLKIIGEHLEITPAIKEYIETKFHHLPIPEKMIQVEFRLGKQGLQQHVKFSSNFNHKNLTIDVTADNAYKAIDQLMKKLHISLTKEKDHEHHVMKK